MFTLPSENAISARASAHAALLWCNDHLEDANSEVLQFANDVCSELDSCVTRSKRYTALTKQREMMWGYFHQLRIEERFTEKWQKFFTITTGKIANSVIIQFLVDQIFKSIVSIHFASTSKLTSAGNADQPAMLSYDEQNALRYAAGYIPKCLRDRLQHSSHPLKRELMWRLLDLTDENDDAVDNESTEWLTMINRGGLQCVTQKTYTLMLSMEVALQQSLRTVKVDFKEQVTENIMKDDDVLFNWLMISGNWESKEAETLFKMITDLWVTIRGFSFTSTWIEKYKIAHHHSIQKSKGIRKQLV